MTHKDNVIGDRTKIRGASCLLVSMLMLIFYACNSKPGYDTPAIKGDRVVIDAGALKDSKPEFFSIKLKGKRVDFFVMKINGSVESYIDACENCYRFKKGYRAEGSNIVCIYCGTSYPLDSLKTGFASCHPMPLRGELLGKEYFILLGDLEKAARFF